MQELLTTAFNAIALLSAAYFSVGLLIHLIRSWRSLQLEEQPATVTTGGGLVDRATRPRQVQSAVPRTWMLLPATVRASQLGSQQPVDTEPTLALRTMAGRTTSAARGRH